MRVGGGGRRHRERRRAGLGVQHAGDALVDRQGEQSPDLVGEHQGLAVLGEGDEAYWAH